MEVVEGDPRIIRGGWLVVQHTTPMLSSPTISCLRRLLRQR